VTDVALGHGCFRRSAGFGVGGIGILRDRESATVAAHSIGSAVTGLETGIGSAAIIGIGAMIETDVGYVGVVLHRHTRDRW
jgi:hypothetical protein